MSNKTHYENLKVANDAPSDVIRAAYKALTQKYSADRNPNAEARKQLEIINNSNSVLSNPVKRAEYDKWLIDQQSANTEKKSDKKPKPNKSKIDFNDGSEIIIGKESDVIAFKQSDSIKRWAIYLTIGLPVLLALAWFGLANEDAVTDKDNAQQAYPSEKISAQTNPSAATASNEAIEPDVSAKHKLDITSIVIPAHDKVSMDKFFGVWQNNATTSQQSLKISKNSENAIVFRLDAKSREGTGGVYGIADYQNGYALFFNEEYDCSILFTNKSNQLKVTTSSCQEYHASGVVFDGEYTKPQTVAASAKPVKSQPAVAKPTPEIVIQPQVTETKPAIVNAPKLYKFSAKVKDAAGNISDIELMAKDKDAARAIIRDFRGNPEVLKIKQLKK